MGHPSKLALMNGQTLQKAFVPLLGGAEVVYNSSGLSYYRHADWLGSSRLATTGSRTVYYDAAYAPFGENYAETGTTDHSFTGQTQDTTPGLYDFLFREQSAVQGRWTSPDPAGLAAVDITNPQTWNRYAYVANNPLSYIDPLGLEIVDCPPGTDPGTICFNHTEWGGGGGGGGPNYIPPSPPDGGGGGGGGAGQPQPQPKPQPSPPKKGNCTAQRVLSGIQGATNLVFAHQKGLATPGAVALGEAAGGPPGAAVAGIYWSVSVTGQATAGAGQLYSAFTGNYGGSAARVTQYGNILSGPASGLWTLATGGSAASAEQRAAKESIALAGAGAVNAFIAQNLGGIIAGASDALNSWVGLMPGASGGCGSTQ